MFLRQIIKAFMFLIRKNPNYNNENIGVIFVTNAQVSQNGQFWTGKVYFLSKNTSVFQELKKKLRTWGSQSL